MEKSFRHKVVILIASLLVCGLLSNGLLYGVLSLMSGDLSEAGQLERLLVSSDYGLGTRCAMVASQLIMFTGSAVLYWWLVRGEPFGKYFGLRSSPDLVTGGLCLLLLIVSYPLISASGMVLDYVDLPRWATQMDDDFSGMIGAMFGNDSMAATTLSLVIVAVLPAVGEELLFRGILQKELMSRLVNPHIAILLTSIIFSGIHFQVQGFLPKLIISYILCYSYYWSRSLWIPMGLHLFNNGMLSIGLLLHGDKLTELPKNESMAFPWLGVIISLFLCVILIDTIRKHIRQEESTPRL